MSILRDFYNGVIPHPWERKPPPRSDEYRDLLHKISEIEARITEKLDSDGNALLQSLKVKQTERDGYTESDLFAFAFSLGFMWAEDIFREIEAYKGGDCE